MRVIEVSARKGGVGTTTVACSIATAIAEKGEKVLLVDNTGTSDAFAVCGMAIPVEGLASQATENMAVICGSVSSEVANAYDVVVVDAGVIKADGQEYWGAKPHTVSVIRNAYLSLKAEVSRVRPDSDTVVVITDENFALTLQDAKSVVGKGNFIEVPYSYDLARAVDAGLFLMRQHTYEWAKKFQLINA